MAMMILDQDKYKSAFLYMLQSLNRIEGKKKVCKLFHTNLVSIGTRKISTSER